MKVSDVQAYVSQVEAGERWYILRQEKGAQQFAMQIQEAAKRLQAIGALPSSNASYT